MPSVEIRSTLRSTEEKSIEGSPTPDGEIAETGAASATALSTPLPWVAWTFSKDLRPDWSQIEGIEPLAVDQFYAKWTGYLSSIDRAAVGEVGPLTLQRVSPPKTTLATRHEITIGPESQRVRFFANVKAPASPAAPASSRVGATRYAVELPADARLLDWRLDTSEEARSGFPNDLNNRSNPSLDTAVGSSTRVTTRDADATAMNSPTLLPTRPWTILRQGNVATLLLTSDRAEFRLVLDAVLPHSKDGKPNKLPLIHVSPISHDENRTTVKSGNTAAAVENEPALTNNAFEQSHELQITRHVDTNVKWTVPVGGQSMVAVVEDAASLLAAGKILIDRYTTTGPMEDDFQAARFRIRQNTQPFDIDSRITLRWEEGRWMAQTDCTVTSKYCPDYLDIALPTRWCDSLQIGPLGISSRQPTLDPAIQVLRLELRRDPALTATTELPSSTDGDDNKQQQKIANDDGDKAEEIGSHTRTFRLISRLAVTEITRVSVPEIRILDARRHRIDVVVPTRLTNEQVRWRSNFAGPLEKPRWRIESTVSVEPGVELSVYAVTSPGWSIDLETLPRTDRLAQLIHADHRVIVRPQADTWLLVSRFDIVPGDQVSAQLSTSKAVNVLGVWAATRPADLRRIDATSALDTTSSIPAEETRWEVPLPLNRLSQTIEVLTSFSKNTDNLLLPALVGLGNQENEVSLNWCEIPLKVAPQNFLTNPSSNTTARGPRDVTTSATPFFANANTPTFSFAQSLSSRERLQWLATSVVQAIRSSSDALADRRDEEVTVWLKPWIVRYRLLCNASGRRIGDPMPGPMAVAADATSDSEAAANSPAAPGRRQTPGRQQASTPPTVLTWEEMDAYILSQETRYFANDTFETDNLNALDAQRQTNTSPRTGSRNDLRLLDPDPSITWSDFLAVTTPPGFADRWTFAWSGRRLPVATLSLQRVPLSDNVRAQVIRVGLFMAIAALLFVGVFFPRHRSNSQSQSQPPTKRNPRVTGVWNHPAFWLFVFGLIGLVLLPLPIALGLMVAAVLLSGGDSLAFWGGAVSKLRRKKGVRL